MRYILTLPTLLALLCGCISDGSDKRCSIRGMMANCHKDNTLIMEMSLPRGGYYTNIANRVLCMHAIQREIVNLSHRNICDDQYLQCKYEQIETAFNNLTSAVSGLESLLRETHNELINSNVRYTADKQLPAKSSISKP